MLMNKKYEHDLVLFCLANLSANLKTILSFNYTSNHAISPMMYLF